MTIRANPFGIEPGKLLERAHPICGRERRVMHRHLSRARRHEPRSLPEHLQARVRRREPLRARAARSARGEALADLRPSNPERSTRGRPQSVRCQSPGRSGRPDRRRRARPASARCGSTGLHWAPRSADRHVRSDREPRARRVPAIRRSPSRRDQVGNDGRANDDERERAGPEASSQALARSGQSCAHSRACAMPAT